MYRILAIAFLLFVASAAIAQDDETTLYYRAYHICAPSAQNQTMKDCNYARMVENYYVICMQQNGFGDLEKTMDKNRYAYYLKSYKQCSAIANRAAQQQCNYGVVYQRYYNKCMAELGFNSNGELLNSPKKDTPGLRTPPVKNPDSNTTTNKGSRLDRFIDSIM